MPPRNQGGCRRGNQTQRPIIEELPTQSPPEPAMRRWPNPAVPATPAPETLAAELHRIGSHLAHQAQLLTEIKALLERHPGP